MSHLSQFNSAVHGLVGDFKKMNYLHKDVAKLETYIEITHINATFNWIKVLCYHAYLDLGIDASEKFAQLQRQGAISSV